MANQSVLELAVGTGKWDSGLRKAQQALNNFTSAQGGLQQALQKDSSNLQQFVQMMGKMDSTANTSKGQMNDYKRVLEQLTSQYNSMSEAQKNSIGQDYLHTIDALKQKFQAAKQQVDEFNRSLGESSNTKLPDVGAGGLFSGDKLSGMLQVFGGNLMTKGVELATSAVTGLINETGEMIRQGVELAKQGEGIRIAFQRLGRGDLLDGLREATHGTMTDIELMKAAVKFDDFKLPLDELGTMLAFAQKKAKDTGQSVDYMAESIVTGLGRKSLMILDNLGLSATEIKERMKETGDMTKAVGDIIRDQMKAAGDYIETAADRAAQANVSLQNKMEELGRKFAPLEEASNTFWTSMKISILDVVGGPLADFLNSLTEAGRRMAMLKNMKGGEEGDPSKVERQLSALRGSNFKKEKYNSQLSKYDQDIRVAEYYKKKYDEAGWAGGSVLSDVTRRFKVNVVSGEDIDNIITSLRTMRSEYVKGAKEIMKPVETNVNTDKSIKGISDLKKQLKELEAQLKKAVLAGDDEQVELLTKQINTTKQKIGYLDPNALKTGSTKVNKDEFTEVIGLIGMAEERVSDLQRRIKEAPDETTITTLRDQLKEAQAELDRLNGKAQDIDLDKLFPDVSTSGGSGLSMGQQMAQSITADLAKGIQDADMQTLRTLMEAQIKNGIEGIDIPSDALMEQIIGEGVDIPESTWQALQDEINAKLKDLGIEPIQIDFSTGNVKKQSKEMSKNWQAAAQAVQAVGSAMSSIEDPAAKIMGTIGQAIASIALGFAQATASDSKLGVFGWIAAIAAGTATMISTIAAIHSATGYANGGMIKGNSYSGDNLMAQGPSGELIGLNAGEIVLNRAQTANVASALQGNGMEGLNLTATIRGEQIRLALNNNGRRTGKGEYVQTNRR